jgi:phosphopantetheine adenylyltransferase
MKFNRYVDLILESISNDKFIVLIPGGFKPPTAGHMHLIASYNNNPKVEKVIVLIGPKERDGITREQSLKVFNLYQINKLKKVQIESTNFENPMQAAFEFLINDARRDQYKHLIFGIGASNKGGDEERSFSFENYFKKNPTKLPPGFRVGVPPIITARQNKGKEVSATDLRSAIRSKNIVTIKDNIPVGVDVNKFLSIF